MRTTTAVAALLLCSILVTGCDLPYEQPAPYGSGGQGAFAGRVVGPDGLGPCPTPSVAARRRGANDRNGGASP